MKRFLAILFALTLLTGCAQTPDAPVVAQKDMDRLIEQGQREPEGNALSDIAATSPENYVWSTSVYNDRVKVNVNAHVTLPGTDAMPMYQISSGEFTQEQVDRIIRYLYEGTAIYQGQMDIPYISKFEYEKELAELQEIIKNGSGDHRWQQYAAVYDEVDGCGEHVTEEYVRMQLKNRVQDVLASIESSSEKPSDILPVSDGQLVPPDDGSNSGAVLMVMDDAQRSLWVTSNNSTSSGYSDLRFSRNNIPEYNLNNAVPAENNEGYEEAKALANGFFEAAGADVSMLASYQVDDGVPESGAFKRLRDGVELSRTPKDVENKGYVFYYTSGAEGFPVAFDLMGGHSGSTEKGSTEFEAMWFYEFAYVVVDADGICYIDWNAPITQCKKVSNNTGLLSFEEIMPVFEEMVTVPYEGSLASEDATGYTDGHYELEVTDIALRLIRTRSTGGERSGVLTPAWVFYGTIAGRYGSNEMGELFPAIVLAINAVDGTVIDVSRGY